MLCHLLSGLALSVTFGDTSPKGRGIADVPKVSNAQIRS